MLILVDLLVCMLRIHCSTRWQGQFVMMTSWPFHILYGFQAARGWLGLQGHQDDGC